MCMIWRRRKRKITSMVLHRINDTYTVRLIGLYFIGLFFQLYGAVTNNECVAFFGVFVWSIVGFGILNIFGEEESDKTSFWDLPEEDREEIVLYALALMAMAFFILLLG